MSSTPLQARAAAARRRSSARSTTLCGYQRQKQIKANIWFAAHECMVHEMPKAFGDVGWVIIDESPLDAFMFGVDINDQVDARRSTRCATAASASFDGAMQR